MKAVLLLLGANALLWLKGPGLYTYRRCETCFQWVDYHHDSNLPWHIFGMSMACLIVWSVSQINQSNNNRGLQ